MERRENEEGKEGEREGERKENKTCNQVIYYTAGTRT